MKECNIIVNADDFGFSEAVNYGIIKAYNDGIVSSTTIMANMPGFAHAIALAKQNPGLHIGVHLNLNVYKPLTSGKTLMKEDGCFDRRSFEHCDEEEVYQEFCAQINKVLHAGIMIDHLDSHRFIHQSPVLKNVIERILKTYPYPIRGGFSYPFDYVKQVAMNDEFYGEDVSIQKLKNILDNLSDNGVYDIVTHPAYIDGFLLNSSSYALARVKELDILCSDEIKDCIIKNNIRVITYADVKFEEAK